ncbi:MAG TPA: polysaccharide biosynthesis tyrosine autokinase [Propylenella sp.]
MNRPLHGLVSPEPASQRPAERPIDLRSMLAVVRRRIAVIVIAAATVVIIAALITSQLERRYTATALLVVDARDSQLVGFSSGPAMFDSGAAVDTEVEIARSPAVLARAIAKLDLLNTPEFALRPSAFGRLLTALGFAEASAGGELPSEWRLLSATQRNDLIDPVSEILAVSRRPLTNVIAISATAESPTLAARIANAVADSYLAEQIDAKVSSSQRAADFLRNRVNDLAREIDDLEARIDAFATSKLADLGTPEARELLRQVDQSRTRRAGMASTLSGLQAALDERDYDRMAQLLSTEAPDFARRRNALLNALEPDGADAAAFERSRQDLSALEDEIRAAAASRVALLRSEVASADNQSARVRAELESVLSRQNIPSAVGAELFRMQSDAEIRRGLYNNYLTKLRQVEQQQVFDLPDSRVIASATPPSDPSFPPMKLIAAATFFLSLTFGFGAGFLRESFIGGVTSTEHLASITGLPVIAAVPRFKPSSAASSSPQDAVLAEPVSPFSESIRRIRLGVELYANKEKPCVFVTSSLPEEGKTTIALALARSFALTGLKTLLIDADLRRPSVSKYVDLRSDYDLTRYLTDSSEGSVGRLGIVTESATGLSFIGGPTTPAAATDTLVMSSRFRTLVEHARSSYDVVVFDTPPVGLVVDPQIIARHADVGVFVAKAGSTGQAVIGECTRELRAATDIPLCAVLNLDNHRVGYGKRYGYYYRR